LNPSDERRSKASFHNIIDTSKEDSRITEVRQLSRKRHLTTDERDGIIRLFDIEHPHRQTNSETDEKEELRGKNEENLKPAISKKTIKCRGAPREVKMWIPYIRGVKISCEEDIERIIKKEFPGVQDRDDYNDILRNGKDHFKLLRAIKNYGHIKQRKVEALAAELGVGNTKAAAWVFYGVVPAVYRWLDKAISKSEGVRIANQLRAELDGIETWQDVEERLDEMYPNGEYQKNRTFKTRKHHATKFLEFLREIGKGGTVNGIASRIGLRPAAVRRFLGGNIPSAIQDVVSSSEGSRIHRTFHRVNIVLPKVRERDIESIHQLREIIGRDFPGFRERENFPSLVRDAEIHYELFLEYRDKRFIPQGVPTELHKRTGLSFDKIKGWLCDGQSPIIYRLLREALSCKEAEKKLDKLLTKLNGVTSMSVLEYRLGNVYVEYEIHHLPRYKKHQERARKFFLFLKGLRGGGLLSDVARRAHLKPDEIRSWFRPDSIPNLVRMAASIPAEPPEDGKKWLPLISTNKRTFKEFIQVPTKITSPEDVLYVMKQLTTLENPRMKEHERKFDMMSKIVGLMYFLGALVSDGYFDESSHVSTYVGLSASKAYNWSRDFGRGFCYALGKIGISSKRGKDSIIEDEEGNLFTQMRWASTSTPLLLWVRRTLLGLEASAPKTWNPIKADWILDAPEDWRIAFIQGASDGDGFASIPNYCTGIATIVNQEFYLRLLKSLGIHGFFHGTHIRIIRKKSINRAKQLPMFRYAEGRQVRLTEMTVMLDSVNRKIASEKEIKIIMKLHDKGHSLGDIVVKLWNKYGISRRPSTIAGIIKRNCPKHVE
jgi:hypothetical protein